MDDEEEEASMGATRYPCMPSLIALQQMKNRLHLAQLGRKLMKWTALATGRELRKIAGEINLTYAGFTEDIRSGYIMLARSRYFNPNLNMMVIENIPEMAAVTVTTTTKTISGTKVLHFNIVEHDTEPYAHLAIEKGGQAVKEAKQKWRDLLKRMIMILELRRSFQQVEEAHKSATKKSNILAKSVIPKIRASLKYIADELDEIEREDTFRLKRFKQYKEEKKGVVLQICACCLSVFPASDEMEQTLCSVCLRVANVKGTLDPNYQMKVVPCEKEKIDQVAECLKSRITRMSDWANAKELLPTNIEFSNTCHSKSAPAIKPPPKVETVMIKEVKNENKVIKPEPVAIEPIPFCNTCHIKSAPAIKPPPKTGAVEINEAKNKDKLIKPVVKPRPEPSPEPVLEPSPKLVLEPAKTKTISCCPNPCCLSSLKPPQAKIVKPCETCVEDTEETVYTDLPKDSEEYSYYEGIKKIITVQRVLHLDGTFREVEEIITVSTKRDIKDKEELENIEKDTCYDGESMSGVGRFPNKVSRETKCDQLDRSEQMAEPKLPSTKYLMTSTSVTTSEINKEPKSTMTKQNTNKNEATSTDSSLILKCNLCRCPVPKKSRSIQTLLKLLDLQKLDADISDHHIETTKTQIKTTGCSNLDATTATDLPDDEFCCVRFCDRRICRSLKNDETTQIPIRNSDKTCGTSQLQSDHTRSDSDRNMFYRLITLVKSVVSVAPSNPPPSEQCTQCTKDILDTTPSRETKIEKEKSKDKVIKISVNDPSIKISVGNMKANTSTSGGSLKRQKARSICEIKILVKPPKTFEETEISCTSDISCDTKKPHSKSADAFKQEKPDHRICKSCLMKLCGFVPSKIVYESKGKACKEKEEKCNYCDILSKKPARPSDSVKRTCKNNSNEERFLEICRSLSTDTMTDHICFKLSSTTSLLTAKPSKSSSQPSSSCKSVSISTSTKSPAQHKIIKAKVDSNLRSSSSTKTKSYNSSILNFSSDSLRPRSSENSSSVKSNTCSPMDSDRQRSDYLFLKPIRKQHSCPDPSCDSVGNCKDRSNFGILICPRKPVGTTLASPAHASAPDSFTSQKVTKKDVSTCTKTSARFDVRSSCDIPKKRTFNCGCKFTSDPTLNRPNLNNSCESCCNCFFRN